MKKDKEKPEYHKFYFESGEFYGLPTEKYLNRKPYRPLNPKHVLSIIPGIIRKIYVKPNQLVKEGDILLELEAMKMYNKILAPMTGKIKHIHVSPGDKIPKDFIMIEYY
ncbi:MAG: acetyl-CoA carboxylase biotin carboxyl carrier protein subunit [Bacteroidales bacterium]|nr:acetyl-CoA carboxylase biotin carboxyl carrier protein subunit [Bacteroidales bacterium]